MHIFAQAARAAGAEAESELVKQRTRDRMKEMRDQTAQCIVHCAVSIIQGFL